MAVIVVVAASVAMLRVLAIASPLTIFRSVIVAPTIVGQKLAAVALMILVALVTVIVSTAVVPGRGGLPDRAILDGPVVEDSAARVAVSAVVSIFGGGHANERHGLLDDRESRVGAEVVIRVGAGHDDRREAA